MNFKGRIAIGSVYNGMIKSGQEIMHINRQGQSKKYKLISLMTFAGLGRIEAKKWKLETLPLLPELPMLPLVKPLPMPENPAALPLINIEEPTIKMTFMVNDSPFAGKEGKFCTSRQIR
jgi:GTP-binding protein